jgi:DNA-binding PadR family transcriptional regulator
MQQIWYAPSGQIYPTLRAMASEGLLDVDLHIQHHRPNRKEYRLSQDGQRELAQWLDEPARLPRMHHEFIHKLFLLDHLGPERRLQFVQEYVHTCETWAAQLAAVDEKFAGTPHGDYAESAACQLLALRHLRRLVDCEISSAVEILATLQAKQLEDPPGRRNRADRPSLVLTDMTMVAKRRQ